MAWLLALLLQLPGFAAVPPPFDPRPPSPSPFPINIVVALPKDAGSPLKNPFQVTKLVAQPVFDIALEDVEAKQILPPGALRVTYEDTELNEALGVHRVFQHVCARDVDAVMGLPYVFTLAPIAKMSGFWEEGVPVFTTTAMADDLGDRVVYPLLTRMMGSYGTLASFVLEMVKPFGWKHFHFLFNDHATASNGRSECYFALSSIKNAFKEEQNMRWTFDHFEEGQSTRHQHRERLKKASMNSNVIFLCASPDIIREIMLASHELGMTLGQFVFFNVDVSTKTPSDRPSIRANESENVKAEEAYRALKTISLRRKEVNKNKNFESRVKKVAQQKYNYAANTGKEYEMNDFVSAFYDAVLLYATAINETIADGLNPRNGRTITSKMWSRTFVGSTGNVSINSKGDRHTDYSLLDLDLEQAKLVEVAYYSGVAGKVQIVSDYHWVGSGPPADSPICGYDQSTCSKVTEGSAATCACSVGLH